MSTKDIQEAVLELEVYQFGSDVMPPLFVDPSRSRTEYTVLGPNGATSPYNGSARSIASDLALAYSNTDDGKSLSGKTAKNPAQYYFQRMFISDLFASLDECISEISEYSDGAIQMVNDGVLPSWALEQPGSLRNEPVFLDTPSGTSQPEEPRRSANGLSSTGGIIASVVIAIAALGGVFAFVAPKMKF